MDVPRPSMQYGDKPEWLARVLAELSTESRDISIRPLLEKMAKELLVSYEMARNSTVELLKTCWLDPNITLICDVGKPGCPIEDNLKIFTGKFGIVEFFQDRRELANRQQDGIRLDFILVVADRGRITSLYKRHRTDPSSGTSETDLILVIMDLNASNDIQRLHYRYLENADHVGKQDRWERVIRIDEEAWKHNLIIPKQQD